MSEPVYQMVRTRAHVTGESLGLKNLKNVGEPLAVYALHSADDAGPTPARASRGGRRTLRIGGLAAIAVVALLLLNRATLLTWLALNLPGVFTTPIEQEIGFATTTDGVRIAYATTG